MLSIPLQKFVAASGGQQTAADMLGLTQPTISKMLRSGREIYVQRAPGNAWIYFEIKQGKRA